MNDLLPLIQILGAMAMLVVPPILLARMLAGAGPSDLAELFRMTPGIPRAAGVQEDDQPAFRFDRPDRRRDPIPIEPGRRAASPMPSTCADDRAA